MRQGVGVINGDCWSAHDAASRYLGLTLCSYPMRGILHGPDRPKTVHALCTKYLQTVRGRSESFLGGPFAVQKFDEQSMDVPWTVLWS